MTVEAKGETGSAGSGWVFLKRHTRAFAGFAAGAAALMAWAVYVFWWFTGNAQSSGLVPAGLGSWTIGNLVNFIVYSILWELLLVGVPLAVGAIAVWRWWKRLPRDEGMGYRLGKGKRTAGSGGAGFFFFVAFALKVYFDGNWNVPISTFTLDYVVGSAIDILVWVAVGIGIPVAIGMAWWARRMLKKV